MNRGVSVYLKLEFTLISSICSFKITLRHIQHVLFCNVAVGFAALSVVYARLKGNFGTGFPHPVVAASIRI